MGHLRVLVDAQGGAADADPAAVPRTVTGVVTACFDAAKTNISREWNACRLPTVVVNCAGSNCPLKTELPATTEPTSSAFAASLTRS